MKHRPPITIIVILILVVAVAAIYYLSTQTGFASAGTALKASGTVETTEIAIAPEVSGKVREVRGSAGDTVRVGDVLFSLDGTLLQAQRSVAQAARDTAQAALESAQSSAAPAIQAASLELLLAQQALKDLNENADQARAQAQQNLANAQQAFKDAKDDRYKKNLARVTQPTIDQARANLIIAQDKLKNAEENYDKFVNRPEDDVMRAQAFSALAAAQRVVEQQQWNLDWLIGLPDIIEIARADAAIALTQANLALAQRRFDELQNGPDPDTLLLLQARLQTAQVQLAACQAKTAVNQAAQVVKQAEANLALIDAQISKLTVTAPEDAVILKRTIEPGEVANPGSVVFTLARKADLTITVYIPEDRYGEIKLGQSAAVQVDSFPGLSFNATVIHIAGKAEFTPRNVQTVEGRKTTVFAIKLQVDDPNSQLKPGMPADVVFN